jgi:hypothetical protein
MSGGLDALLDAVFPVVPAGTSPATVEAVGIEPRTFEVGDEVVAYAERTSSTAAPLPSW